MKTFLQCKLLLSLLVVFSAFTASTATLAKSINLYDQPNQSSRVVGTIDPSTGVIPIFTPKGSGWIKIGDPSNGNVGWVKSSDILNGGSTSFSFNQKIMPQSAQKAMQEIIDNINRLYKQQPELLHNNGTLPVIMPIVIVPASTLKGNMSQ